MDFLHLFSGIHMVFGDIFSVVAVVGTAAMLLDVFVDEDVLVVDKLGRSGIAGFVLGILGQVSFFVTGTEVDSVGVVFRLPPSSVASLLLISFR